MIRKTSIASLALLAAPLHAQAMPDMPGMDMSAHPAAPAPSQAPDPSAPPPAHDMGQMDPDMPGMDRGGHAMGSITMHGALGAYAMTREASGTSWQPDSSAMAGLHITAGPWMIMVHGDATLVYDDQGGPRGDSKTFSQSMLMGMASRSVGDNGTLGLRAMLSLDPLMGKSGYPLLFATGETANGKDELVDRQHPHDLFMELSASYSYDLGRGRSVYLYGGLPGEPALGPPTFMHRISGMDDPEAPIGHHWFDSTHVTFGVVTAGFSDGPWKVEASAFKGREPDQYRWNIESPKLDSWSVRGFWNPTANLSFQLSTGHIHSPEQLDPTRNEQRTTASVSYNLPLGQGASWASTLAWARKDEKPGPALTGWLGETALHFEARHTIFLRAEHVQEAELFESGPLAGEAILISKLSLGYSYELPMTKGPVRIALGGLTSAYAFPDRIRPDYGHEGVKSFMLFARLHLARG